MEGEMAERYIVGFNCMNNFDVGNLYIYQLKILNHEFLICCFLSSVIYFIYSILVGFYGGETLLLADDNDSVA